MFSLRCILMAHVTHSKMPDKTTIALKSGINSSDEIHPTHKDTLQDQRISSENLCSSLHTMRGGSESQSQHNTTTSTWLFYSFWRHFWILVVSRKTPAGDVMTSGFSPSLTHSLPPSVTHSLTHSLTRSFLPSLPHSLTHSLTHPLAPSLTLSLAHPLAHFHPPSLTH